MNQKGFARIALIAVLILLNVGCDQKTKQIAQDTLNPHEVSNYFFDTFRIIYAENEGAFLSAGSDLEGTWHFILLKLLPVTMLLFLLLYTIFSKSIDIYQTIALSFILGGGISNIIDRLTYGKVIDFMNMGIGNLRTGIFNFADLSIMLGITIFIFANYFKNKSAEQPSNTP
jgi:signal peptidase II